MASHITAFEHQEAHLFTPQEASKLLPDIRPKVKELQGLLFIAGGDAATELESAQQVPRISASDTKRIEEGRGATPPGD